MEVESIEKSLGDPQKVAQNSYENFSELIIEYWKDDRKIYKKWSNWTILFIAISLILVFLGAILAFFGRLEVGTLSLIGGIFTTTISKLFLSNLKKTQDIITTNQIKIEEKFKESVAQYYDLLNKKKIIFNLEFKIKDEIPPKLDVEQCWLRIKDINGKEKLKKTNPNLAFENHGWNFNLSEDIAESDTIYLDLVDVEPGRKWRVEPFRAYQCTVNVHQEE